MIEEKLTPAIRAVKEAFAEKLSYFPEYFGFGCIPYVIVEEAMNKIGFTPDWNNCDYNHSSGDIDYWVVFRNKDKDFSYILSASMLNPRAEIEKKPKDYKLYQ